MQQHVRLPNPTRRSFTVRRLIAPFVAVLTLAASAPAWAADETTTTTIVETTTTTLPPDTTTTTIVETTTTSYTDSTTTTEGGEATTTTVPGSTTTTTPTVDDPLEEEAPTGLPELPLPSIRFPLARAGFYRDSFGDPRDGGARSHNGIDIFAPRGTPVVSVGSGVVIRMGDTPTAGQFVVVRHGNGWRSVYAHFDNDSPGTDNGLAMGFGPGIRVGARVRAGTVLGYVGDSGNSEDSVAHLHFELHQPDGLRANPYEALRASRRVRASTLSTVRYRDVEESQTEMLGHLDPGFGFNADLAVDDGHVYLGSWGTGDRCPGRGIRVIEVTDPEDPEELAVFADHTEYPGTAAASIWVGEVTTDSYTGRIGVVGLTDCGNPLIDDGEVDGFAVYGLEDPSQPVLMSRHETGEGEGGLAQLDVNIANGRVLIAGIVPTVRPNTSGPMEEVAFFDITDPRRPVALVTWAPETDPTSDQSPKGPLDTGSLTWSDVDTVSASLHPGGSFDVDIVFGADQTATVEAEATLAPVEIGQLASLVAEVDEEEGESDGGGSVESPPPHRFTDVGLNGRLYAWLEHGARLVGLEDPLAPVELASAVPAPAFDPQRWWSDGDDEIRTPMVWDVAESNGLLYVSDHHSGLWVFRLDIDLPSAPSPSVIS